MTALWSLPALLALLFATAAAAQSELSFEGRALYQGHRSFEAGRNATSLRLPPASVACARCHGPAGEGGREGTTAAPALNWAALFAKREGRPAFESAELVKLAITQGLGRNGGALSAVMPRYRLTERETAALLAYLRLVGTQADLPPGVSQNSVRLATFLPLSGSAAGVGASIREGLQHVFAAANQQGGIHGRRIELEPIDTVPEGAAAAARALLRRPPYAMVASVWPGGEPSIPRLFAEHHIASIAPLLSRTPQEDHDPWSVELLAPLGVQQEALAAALQGCPENSLRYALEVTPSAPRGASGEHWAENVGLLRDALAREAHRGCVAIPFSAAGKLALPSDWEERVVLPFPAILLNPGPDGSRPDLWRRLGDAAGRLAVELLARAGPQLHERSLLEVPSALGRFEPYPGAPVRFSKARRHGWDAEVVTILVGERDATSPNESARRPDRSNQGE